MEKLMLRWAVFGGFLPAAATDDYFQTTITIGEEQSIYQRINKYRNFNLKIMIQPTEIQKLTELIDSLCLMSFSPDQQTFFQDAPTIKLTIKKGQDMNKFVCEAPKVSVEKLIMLGQAVENFQILQFEFPSPLLVAEVELADKSYTYLSEYAPDLQLGDYVLVPFGQSNSVHIGQVKNLKRILAEEFSDIMNFPLEHTKQIIKKLDGYSLYHR